VRDFIPCPVLYVSVTVLSAAGIEETFVLFYQRHKQNIKIRVVSHGCMTRDVKVTEVRVTVCRRSASNKQHTRDVT